MSYLNSLVHALEMFYRYDDFLIEPDDIAQHEQTISFRLAKYLSEELEGGEECMVIDCEYQRMVKDDRTVDYKRLHKYLVFERGCKGCIRPDIIYHKRGCNAHNTFIIEIKKGNHIDEKGNDDIQKVKDEVNILGYQEGFCIYDITKESVTIFEAPKNISYTYKVIRNDKEEFSRLERDNASKNLSN